MASIQPHIVFMNLPATGHMNPTLPLVARLHAAGCAVSYFVDASMQSVVEAAGARWHPFRCADVDLQGMQMLPAEAMSKYLPDEEAREEFERMPFASMVYSTELCLPALLEELRAMEPAPALIVYDPFLAVAEVVAHVLQIPSVATVTMPGPGVLAVPDAVKQTWDAKEWVAGPARNILETYGCDVLKSGSIMEFYSSTLNLVTTIDELFVPPRPGRQAALLDDRPFRCVGVMADSKVKRIANAGLKAGDPLQEALPMEEIARAVSSGRKLLYVSMGTVATGRRWTRPFGFLAASNGLADCTGKQLVQHVFRCCYEAFGKDEDFLVIMSLGIQSDALEGLPAVPSNFIVRAAVPQLEVLQHCAAFLTHGGANSMHEALSYGVPMAVVPVFGDQPHNAASIVRCGAGLGFPQPLTSVTSASLSSAISRLSATGNGFRAAAQDMSAKISKAGGVDAAAGAILKLVDNRAVHKVSLGGA